MPTSPERLAPLLRVGLTGDLGSGKSTVARLLGLLGAIVLSSDDMARQMMEPGELVFREIVEHFGPDVLAPSGRLDRAVLARLAFDPEKPRIEELNRLIHPAVLAEQERQIEAMRQTHADAIVVVESALIFSVKSPPGTSPDAPPTETLEPWRERFDVIVVVTAPREMKMTRAMSRSAAGSLSQAERDRLAADVARRLDTQAETSVPDDDSVVRLPNDGDLATLEQRVHVLWSDLQRRAKLRRQLTL